MVSSYGGLVIILVLPIVLAVLLWLILDPATFWQRLAGITVVAIVHVTATLILSSIID